MFEYYREREPVLLPEFEQLLSEHESMYSEFESILPGLPEIKHFTNVKKLNAAGKLASKGTEEMSPDKMNPGYFDASGNLKVNTTLQQAVTNLVTTRYKKYVNGSAPSKSDKIFIALVDLSGDKFHKPQFSGWGPTFPKYPASTAKIAALYGIMQLKFDLQKRLADAGITKTADVPNFLGEFQKKHKLPGYELSWSKIFDYVSTASGIQVNISAALDKLIVDTFKNNNNYSASQLIKNVSYKYLASVLLQSGITSPSLGGLWITGGYGGTGSWGDPPRKKFSTEGSNSATALSCATYFTLMAQGRLVNDASSVKISNYLNDACSFFWSARAQSVISIAGNIPTKCGVWSKYKSDVILVNDQNGKHRFVACVLTELAGDKSFSLDDMLIDLNGIIKANNP
jgi:hypothetical protein